MDYEKFFLSLFCAICLFLALISSYSLTKHIFADGEVDYCYIQAWSNNGNITTYSLQGHRSWTSDHLIGNYTKNDDAVDFANKIGCRLGIKK